MVPAWMIGGFVRRMLTACFVVVLAVVPLLQGSPSSAHLLQHFDADDAKTDDLKSVGLDVYKGPNGVKRLLASAELYPDEQWPADCCWEVWFKIDSRGNGHADYVLHAAFDNASGGIYLASLERPDGTRLHARVSASQPCADCVDLRMKFRALHATRHLRWRVMTHDDRAPDTGWYSH